MTSIKRDNTRLALLARMLRDQRAGRLADLADYLREVEGEDTWVAHHFLRLTGSVDDAAPGPGELAAGKRRGAYVLEAELGRGGQGTVWRARDERLGRDIALKVLPNPPGAPDAGPRFRREAMLAARLDHPAICPVYDAGSDGRDSWIAMRLVDGCSLSSLPEPARLEVTLARFQELAEALATAHRAGVVHRDVKPSNVMITPEGRPVLLDFGVALGDDAGAPLTLTGDALGTPAYMSPEQLSADCVIDARTDVWSLGVTLYEALTGRRPFDAPTREALVQQILTREPPALDARFPRDLAVVVSTALSKELARRYSGAQDLADELGRVMRHEPVRARPLGVFGRAARWTRREPRFAGSLAVFVTALSAALVALLLVLDRTTETLAERNQLLDEVDRTSAQKLARDLLDAEPGMWPALPGLTESLDNWVQDTEELLADEGEHRARREHIAGRIALAPTDQRAWDADQLRDAWLLTQLDELLAGLDELRLLLPDLQARATFAREVTERTISAHAQAWAAAAAAVASDPRFEGLVLAPQIGLIPLGADPVSGLQEFAHLASGEPASRGADGALAIGAENGIVLVLLPGAETQYGCRLPDADHPVGSPWVDAGAKPYEVGLMPASHAPFLVSKYEVSQAQWERQAGENPSYYQFGDEPIALRPVEQVSWIESVRVLAELDLELPREDEWEYLARAGTTTRWHFGEEPEQLRGFGNVSDLTAKQTWKNTQFSYEEWLEDGFADPAPIGRFGANGFGLLDIVGNVQEWTATGWSWPGEKRVPRSSDRPPTTASTCVTRGGAFGSDLRYARSATRRGYSRGVRSYQVGVRPIRRLR